MSLSLQRLSRQLQDGRRGGQARSFAESETTGNGYGGARSASQGTSTSFSFEGTSGGAEGEGTFEVSVDRERSASTDVDFSERFYGRPTDSSENEEEEDPGGFTNPNEEQEGGTMPEDPDPTDPPEETPAPTEAPTEPAVDDPPAEADTMPPTEMATETEDGNEETQSPTQGSSASETADADETEGPMDGGDETTEEDESLQAFTDETLGSGDIMSSCPTDTIPQGASNVIDQLLVFQYNLYLKEQIEEPQSTVDAIEGRLHTELANAKLDCLYDGDSSFEVQYISSSPEDQAMESCGENCWVVSSRTTTGIFYLARRRKQRLLRRLQDDEESTVTTQQTITDLNVLNSFGAVVEALFEDDGEALFGDNDDIEKLEFGGFTNAEGQQQTFEADDPTSDRTTIPTVSAAQGSEQPADKGNTKIIAGSVTVAVAVVALLAVIAIAVRRRQRNRSLMKNNDTDDTLWEVEEGTEIFFNDGRGKRSKKVNRLDDDNLFVLSDLRDFEAMMDDEESTPVHPGGQYPPQSVTMSNAASPDDFCNIEGICNTDEDEAKTDEDVYTVPDTQHF